MLKIFRNFFNIIKREMEQNLKPKKLSKKEKRNLKEIQKEERRAKYKLEPKPPKVQDDSHISEPVYIKEGPFRMVEEYNHLYKCFVKDRWKARTVEEVFKKEFCAYTEEYYVIPYQNFLSFAQFLDQLKFLF